MRRVLLPAVVALVSLLASVQAAHATQPLTTGFNDPIFGTGHDADSAVRYDDAARVGARIVSVYLGWFRVASSDQAPTGDLSDPANPAYNWISPDTAVRDAADRGLSPMLNMVGAPPWAE